MLLQSTAAQEALSAILLHALSPAEDEVEELHFPARRTTEIWTAWKTKIQMPVLKTSFITPRMHFSFLSKIFLSWQTSFPELSASPMTAHAPPDNVTNVALSRIRDSQEFCSG